MRVHSSWDRTELICPISQMISPFLVVSASRSWNFVSASLNEQMIADYNNQHRQILNAIRSREPERAANQMKTHLEGARVSLMRVAEA